MSSAPSSSTPTPVVRRKFLVVTCDDSEKWKGFDRIFQRLFGDETTDEWKFLDCVNQPEGYLPSDAEILEYDGIVLPGSKYTTYEDAKYPWIGRFHEFVKRINNVPATADRRGRGISGPRVIGICFGAQSIAHSLGGECAKNAGRHYAIGSEPLTTTAAFEQLLTDLNVAKEKAGFVGEQKLRLLESHFDAVKSLPPSALLLATSPSAPHEMFALPAQAPVGVTDDEKKTQPIRFIGSQGHPEFTPAVIEDKILPNAIAGGALTTEGAEVAKESMRQPLSSEGVLAVLRAFIRS